MPQPSLRGCDCRSARVPVGIISFNLALPLPFQVFLGLSLPFYVLLSFYEIEYLSI